MIDSDQITVVQLAHMQTATNEISKQATLVRCYAANSKLEAFHLLVPGTINPDGCSWEALLNWLGDREVFFCEKP